MRGPERKPIGSLGRRLTGSVNLGTVKWLAAVVVVVALTFGHLLGPFDLHTFLQAGAAVLRGHSPYPSVHSAVFRSGHAFVYPLFVAWLFAPLALLPRHPAEILYAIGSVLAIVVSSRLLGRRDFTAAALVLACSTTITGLQMGTVNAFLMLGLAASWHWRRSHPVLSGIALGLTATAKLFLLPVLLWPFLRRRLTPAVSAFATVIVLIGAGGLFGTESPSHYLHLLSQLQANEVVSSWSLSSFFQGLSLSRTAASAVAVALVAACLLVLWRRRSVVADGRLLGALVGCSLLMSPIVWSSYLLLLTVPLLLLTDDDLVLAAAAAASWLVVTPDAASWARVAIGAGTALILSYLVARSRFGELRVLLSRRRWLLLVPIGVVTLVTAELLLPNQVRSPLPALVAMGVIVARCAGWRSADPRLAGPAPAS